MADKVAHTTADIVADNYEDKNEEILEYNINLFVEAIDMIDAANILLSLKMMVNI
jgi:hypothetical protein